MRNFLILAVATTVVAGMALAQQRTPSPKGAEVYIVSPADGAVVSSPVRVVFGLRGMGIAPAGVKVDNTGHHHLLIDTAAPANLGTPLPMSDKIVHYGGGQTEAMVKLAPGKHTLQLLLADFVHIPHDPLVISKKITITVK